MKWICKRMLPLLLALFLLAGNAWAAENVSMAVNFRQEDQFYGFAALNQWPETLKGELRSAGLALPLRLGPVKLTDSGLPVTYLLLVDRSGSMKYVNGWVTRFIAALEDADKTDAHFLLATFGEKFSLEWDGWAETGTAAEAADRITYTDQITDLSQGVLDAVDYLKKSSREPGELLNLVVITDGIPDKSEDSPALAEVARQLAEEPAILVHTFGLRTDDAGSQEALEALGTLGQGLHQVGNEDVSARKLGEETAGFVNDLCVVSFPWNDQNTGSTELVFSWEDEGEQVVPLAMEDVPVVAGAGDENGEDDPAAPDDPEPPEEPDGAEDDPKDPGQADGAEAPDDPENADNPETPGNSENGKNPEDADDAEDKTDIEDGEEDSFGWIIWTAAGAVALALLVLLLLLFFRRRNGAVTAPPKGSIYMRVEVIAGAYAGPGELYLTDELIVGRGRRCDIPWKDKEVASRNSRIFLRDNVVFLEDLGSQEGTALGGMRLHSPNRLRSGDEISIGPVRFRLKF